MSAGDQWRIVSPAPASAALDLAPRSARVRRMLLAQVRASETAALYRGDDPIVLVMFGRHGWRRTEMAVAFHPQAGRHVRRIIRAAQLTLWRMADARLIVASVNPANAAGQRMAMLIGFVPARLKTPGLWVFRR